MRKIKKEMVVREYECVVYDRAAKAEKTVTITAVGDGAIEAPENCAVLESKALGEKTIKYVMSAQDFMKYAKPDTKPEQ